MQTLTSLSAFTSGLLLCAFSPAQDTATVPDSMFVNQPIPGARCVVDVKKDAKNGSEVIIIGRIGGSKSPFVKSRAVFNIADTSLLTCNQLPEDDCPTPWDFCCEDRKSLIARMATIEFVDAAGKPLATGLNGVHGLAPSAIITVKGVIRDFTATGSLVIDAQQVYLHPAGGTDSAAAAPAAPTIKPFTINSLTNDGVAAIDPWADGNTETLVLFFVNTDCPVANALQPEISRIVERFPGDKFKFISIYPDPSVTAEKAREHGKKFSIPTTLALDHSQELAKALGVTITPEVAVLSKGNVMIYRGRVNDLYARIGERRPAPTTNDLRDALDAIKAGNTPAYSSTTAIGCFLPPIAAASK